MRRIVFACLFASPTSSTLAATLDAQGNYEITYTNCQGGTSTFVYMPHNKVVPRVRVALAAADPFHSTMTYTVANGAGAAQPIDSITFTIVPAVSGAIVPDGSAPAGFGYRTQALEDGGTMVAWTASFSNGGSRPPPVTIAGGSSLTGFRVDAKALAGFTTATIQGYVPEPGCNPTACPDCPAFDNGQEWESPDLESQLLPLVNLGVDLLVIAPKVPLGVDDQTAMNLKAEVATWPAIRQASPTFVTQASPKFDALAAAVHRRNAASIRATGHDLETFANASTDADLSAQAKRVLSFDVDLIVAQALLSK